MILFAANPCSAFKELCISSAQELKLTFLSCEDPSKFHCQPADRLQEFESMMDEIQDYVTSQSQSIGLSVGDLVIEQPVLAQFSEDDRWYRATVITTDEEADTISVFYVDFGNQETLPSSKLCPIPAKFLSLPKLELSCSLYGVQACSGDKWSEESVDCFSILMLEGELVEALVIEVLQNSCLEVSLHSEGCQDFAKHLIDKGHARKR